MADVEVVRKQIEQIRGCIFNISRITLTQTKLEFRRDAGAMDEAEHNLQTAIQGALDIGNGILADLKIEAPEDHRKTFSILASRGVLSRDLADRLALIAGLRDVPLRGYVDLDHGILYEAKRDFEAFIEAVSKLL